MWSRIQNSSTTGLVLDRVWPRLAPSNTHTLYTNTHTLYTNTHTGWSGIQSGGVCINIYCTFISSLCVCATSRSPETDRVCLCVFVSVCSLVCCLCLTTTQWQQTLAGNMGKLSACLPQKKNLTKTLTQICCEECVSKVWQHCKTSRNTLNAFSRFKPTHTHTHTHTLHPSPPCV